MTRRFLFAGIGLGFLMAAGCGGDSHGSGQRADGGESGSSTGGTSGTGMGGASGAATGGLSGSSGGTDLRSCEVPSDCVLVGSSCCVCGVPELGDVTAVNVGAAEEYLRTLCAMSPACGCPTALNPNLVATCASETCQAIDIREHAASECSDDSECRVRVSQCCECGGDTSPGSLIAVGLDLGYDDLVCDPLGLCADCAPEYPSEASVACEADHCTVVDERL